MSFRETQDDIVLLLSVHSSVLSGGWDPGNLGNESLSVGRLGSLWRNLIRVLTERAIGFLFEEIREEGPGEGLGLHIIRIWVILKGRHKNVPKISHLVLTCFQLISWALEVLSL